MKYQEILAGMKRESLAAKRHAAQVQRYGSAGWKPGVGPIGPVMCHLQKGRIQFKVKGQGCWPAESIKSAGAWHATKAFLGTNTVKH